MQSVTSFLVPPITAVFLMAIFWPRANEQVGLPCGAIGGVFIEVGQSQMSLKA